MSGRSALAALLLATTLTSAGCHTLHFWVGDAAPERVEYDWQSFFFWGLTPEKTVDVREHCPNGAVAIREEKTFFDVMLGIVTLGIWTPRSSWYHCAPAGS